MKTSFCHLTIIAFIFLTACDITGEDQLNSVPKENVDLVNNNLYIYDQGSGLIDLQSIFSQTQSLRYSISDFPKHGEVKKIDTYLLQYTPDPNTGATKDSIGFSIYTLSNEFLKKDFIIFNITDALNLPCGLYPKTDSVEASNSTAIEIDVVKNDILCSEDDIYVLSIVKHGTFGISEITNQQTVHYTVTDTSFESDTLIYKITSSGKSGYGIIYVHAPSTLPPPPPLRKKLKQMDFYQLSLDEVIPMFSYTYKYNGELLEEMTETRNYNGTYTQFHRYTYNEAKQPIKDSVYNEFNVIAMVYTYEYINNAITKISIEEPWSHTIIQQYDFTYNLNEAAIDIFMGNVSPGDLYVKKIEITFNEEGDIAHYKNFTNTGVLNSEHFYKYDNHINPLEKIPFGAYNVTILQPQEPEFVTHHNVIQYYTDPAFIYWNDIEYDKDGYPVQKLRQLSDGTFNKITFNYF